MIIIKLLPLVPLRIRILRQLDLPMHVLLIDVVEYKRFPLQNNSIFITCSIESLTYLLQQIRHLQDTAPVVYSCLILYSALRISTRLERTASSNCVRLA